jgi:hypothetical protein
MVPAPVLLTEKVVLPALLDTARSAGVTVRIGCVAGEKVAVWLMGPFIVIVVDRVVPLYDPEPVPTQRLKL